MIDELREERIVNKVGGRFKLSTLIQKRLVALNAGSRPLVALLAPGIQFVFRFAPVESIGRQRGSHQQCAAAFKLGGSRGIGHLGFPGEGADLARIGVEVVKAGFEQQGL